MKVIKIMFDTNVILDVLLAREPFVAAASELFIALETGQLQGLIAATTVTTIFYLATKVLGASSAKNSISRLLQLFEVAPINRVVLEQAVNTSFSDFEDAILYQSAVQAGAHGLVTRDIQGFKKAELPIYTPMELLKSFLPQVSGITEPVPMKGMN